VRAQLFGRVLSLESRKLMSYRVDFWLNVLVSFATQLAVAYFVWLAVFEHTRSETIGGFTFAGMVLYYILVILLGRIVRGQERDMAVSTDVYEGALTKYLLYPTDYFGFKYAAHLGDLVPGLVQLVSFWADNVWSLNVMLRFSTELLGGLMLPLSLFPQWTQDLLVWTPFPYLFYVPVMVLLGEVGVVEWAQGLAVAAGWIVVASLIALRVWRRGTLSYTGVGI